MSQNIINPDRRDPSKIRNKADIGLSRVDNVSVSDILDITKDLVRDEVYSGDRYAERELDMGVLFEIPLCMFTDNSTKLSITVSFLKGNEILSNITARISHSYDTDYRRDPFEIEFDSLDNLVLNSGNFVSFYFYEKKDNKQSVLSLRGDGNTLNKTYGITAVSYYFSDYIVVSNDKEEHLGFKKLTDKRILTGSEVGYYYQSSGKIYEPHRSDRSNASTAKSLSVYDSSGNLIYDNSLNLTKNQANNHSFPTINEVPFTGSKDIIIDGKKDSTRNITIYAQHSGSTSEQAGAHDWEVLSTVRILNADKGTTEVISLDNTGKNLYGLCKSSKNTSIDVSGKKPIEKLNTILTELDSLSKSSVDSVISVSTFKEYLNGICSILKNILQTTGDLIVQFYKDSEKEESYSYVAISPYIGKKVTIYFSIKTPTALSITGKFEKNDIVKISKLAIKDEDVLGSTYKEIDISEDNYSFTIYTPETGTTPPPSLGGLQSSKNLFGYVTFETIGNPFVNNVYPKLSFISGEDENSSNEISIQLKLKTLSNTSVFASENEIKFNPIILTRACIYQSTGSSTSIQGLLSSKKEDYYTNNYFDCGTNLGNSSGLLWKSLTNSSQGYEYGLILPPQTKSTRTEGSSSIFNYFLLEGYSVSRYFKLKFNYPEQKKFSDYFDESDNFGFNILIKDSSSINSQKFSKIFNSNGFKQNEDNIIDLFKNEQVSSLGEETHGYDRLTISNIFAQDLEFGYSNSSEYECSNYRFYLLFCPKYSNKSIFDIKDPKNNPTIEIIPCNEDGTIVSGEEVKVTIMMSQLRMPLFIESIDAGPNDETYGVYSKLRLLYSDGYKGQSNIDVKALNPSIEEFKLPITLNSMFISNESSSIIEDTNLENTDFVKLTPRIGYTFNSADDKKLSLEKKDGKYYLKVVYKNVTYSLSEGNTDSNVHLNYLESLTISNLENFLNKEYNEKNIWFSQKHYPDELLPQNKVNEFKYDLTHTSDYTVSKTERRNNVVFALKRLAFTNYCPISSIDNSLAPSKHIHYNSTNYEVGSDENNEIIPENEFGEGKEYIIYCKNRTWGDTSSRDDIDADLVRRLSNYLVRFGFEYDLSANFAQEDLEIDATLEVSGPNKISDEAGSDVYKFVNYQKSKGKRPPLYNTDNNYIKDRDNIGTFVTKYNANNQYRNWKMTRTLKFHKNAERFGAYPSTLEADGKTYGLMNTKRDYNLHLKSELASDNKMKGLLIFFPQHSDPDKSDKYYSVHTLQRSLYPIKLNDQDGGLQSYDSHYRDISDTTDKTFPWALQVFDFKTNNTYVDDFLKIYPRMISLRDSDNKISGNTTLKLKLKFFIRKSGDDYIPVDVNNGLGNNELNYTFTLIPSDE